MVSFEGILLTPEHQHVNRGVSNWVTCGWSQTTFGGAPTEHPLKQETGWLINLGSTCPVHQKVQRKTTRQWRIPGGKNNKAHYTASSHQSRFAHQCRTFFMLSNRDRNWQRAGLESLGLQQATTGGYGCRLLRCNCLALKGLE